MTSSGRSMKLTGTDALKIKIDEKYGGSERKYEANPGKEIEKPEGKREGPLAQLFARHAAEGGDFPKTRPQEAHVAVVDEVRLARHPTRK